MSKDHTKPRWSVPCRSSAQLRRSALGAIGVVCGWAGTAAANIVHVDASQMQGATPHYERNVSTVLRTRGPMDIQLMKDVGIGLVRTFYEMSQVCTAEGQYDYTGNTGGYYGNDNLGNEIVMMGPVPSVDLFAMPRWLSSDNEIG